MFRHDDVAESDARDLHRLAATGGVTRIPDPSTDNSTDPGLPAIVIPLRVPGIGQNPDGWAALAEAVFAHPGRPLADLRDPMGERATAQVIDLEGHRRRRSEGR